MSKVKLARVATVPIAFIPILKTLKDLNEKYDMDIVSSHSDYANFLMSETGANFCNVEIPRDINPLQDLKALFGLIRSFRKNKYEIIHSNTPKAGLLCAIAGVIAGVKIRIHTFTGQRWATLGGIKRLIFKMIDRLIVSLNTVCLADSASQVKYLEDEGVARAGRILCLGDGSYGGVDLSRFSKENKEQIKERIYNEYKISKDETTFLYVGRVTRDKGIKELIAAIKELEGCKVLIVGLIDESHHLSEDDLQFLKTDSRIIMTGFQDRPEDFMKASDVLVLPSYREGFGSVVIEAAACGACAIGTDISGLQDAIVDEKTGVLVKSHDVETLKSAMNDLITNKDKIESMSDNAYNRVVEKFSSDRLSALQEELYKKLLGNK